MSSLVGVVAISILIMVVTGAALADNPVDLRGKQGVVDPGTLKASDPKSLAVNAPPPQLPQQQPPTSPVGMRG